MMRKVGDEIRGLTIHAIILRGYEMLIYNEQHCRLLVSPWRYSVVAYSALRMFGGVTSVEGWQEEAVRRRTSTDTQIGKCASPNMNSGQKSPSTALEDAQDLIRNFVRVGTCLVNECKTTVVVKKIANSFLAIRAVDLEL